MPNFICEKCKKDFTKKSAYTSHIMRINSCVKDNTISNDCEYCNRNFSNKYNLNSHINICKKKKSEDDTKIQIEMLKKMLYEQQKKFEEQQKDNQELKKKVEELSHITEGILPSGNINVTENSHNTTNNNITNNFNIYSIGKEDLSLLSKEDVLKICTSGTYYPIVAAQILHCNEKYPEFQNYLIPNLRSNTGLVKINDNWVSKSHEEIFRTLLKVDKSHVSSLMKDIEVDTKLQVKLESTQDEIDTGESKEHQIPKIKENLYNSSKMVIKNKKKDDKLLIK